MNEPTKIADISLTRLTKCDTCEKHFEQTALGEGRWYPKSHPDCIPADPQFVERQAVASAAEQRRQQEMRAQLLGVPPLYAGVSFENYRPTTTKQREILELSRQFVRDYPSRMGLTWGFPQVVLMVGPFGTGKGHLAWSIAKEVAQLTPQPGGVKFAKCSDIIRDLRQSWGGNDGESETKRLLYWRKLDLLVIDEVSSHALYGEPSRHLYDLIDNRQEYLRPTIVTTNEEAQGVADLLGPALVSRAAGWGGVWQFDGEDYREKMRTLRAL